MAELYRFFDGTVDDPRAYSADEFAEYFRQFIRNGVFNGGDELQVSSENVGMKTYVRPGKAWISGYFYKNTESLYLDHAVSHATLDRIDRVVLRLDHGLRTIDLKVLTGIPSATPQPPAITRDSNTFELSLAQVNVKAGAVSVSPANIVDERFDGELCGIVTHLFEDTNAIFGYFEEEWQKWFGEIEDTTNLVPKSHAFLFMSQPEFELVVQDEDKMQMLLQQFLAFTVVTQNAQAMDAVVNSEVAVDAVASSEVAMDAIVSSETAMNAVAGSGLAMGAAVNSELAMGAIVGSEVAVDAVASSEVAMDAIANSDIASSSMIAQGLPYSFSNAIAEFNDEDGFVKITRTSGEDTTNFLGLATTLDLTNKTKLRVWASADTLGDDRGYMEAGVYINNELVLSLNGANSDLSERVINVSKFSGRATIEFGYLSRNYGGYRPYTVRFSKFVLE